MTRPHRVKEVDQRVVRVQELQQQLLRLRQRHRSVTNWPRPGQGDGV
jgi:hypothetical protein